MNGRPPLLPAGPGPVLDAKSILDGTVDMRTYQRKHLIIYAQPRRGLAWDSGLLKANHHGTLSTLTSCIEWLDMYFGWEVVSVFTRQVDKYYIHHAMLRRRAANQQV
ncbi:hypothetical protein [Nocardia gamkensis]|uniref:Uncharacterized protein n=1 Tax=Nocardia gamkensis TaxID=352869 RepID=A0A7X6R2M1_9NOCA|nr:hypothetical protein [Nocardia gamkensis]NKY26468.1 hypothetical protein [Nocardia gamkensis]NQE67705.1 hypothetical protein [Nocardia gamkensis]